jgi:hypothetical protein
MQGKPGGELAALEDLANVTGQRDAFAALSGMPDSFSPGFDHVTPINMPSTLPDGRHRGRSHLTDAGAPMPYPHS